MAMKGKVAEGQSRGPAWQEAHGLEEKEEEEGTNRGDLNHQDKHNDPGPT